ncbi:hypothetical protein M422DRAFT_261199 [Sphaerobolus stellatus SS14]|uniref:Uncharacterized protein n=1 Tax=Sphaerobolus stellatus (strain SS14) TaxID=990650 RepID=A0A0C9U133_SPHS4|nr:hypothetical protein M422DRAFT_261199 [Sphaerobolus stellatus SS14]
MDRIQPSTFIEDEALFTLTTQRSKGITPNSLWHKWCYPLIEVLISCIFVALLVSTLKKAEDLHHSAGNCTVDLSRDWQWCGGSQTYISALPNSVSISPALIPQTTIQGATSRSLNTIISTFPSSISKNPIPDNLTTGTGLFKSSPTAIASSNPTVIATSSPTIIATTSTLTVITSSSPTIIATSSRTVIASSSPTIIASSSLTVIASSSPTIIATSSPTIIASSSLTVIASSSPTVIASSSLTVIASITVPTFHPIPISSITVKTTVDLKRPMGLAPFPGPPTESSPMTVDSISTTIAVSLGGPTGPAPLPISASNTSSITSIISATDLHPSPSAPPMQSALQSTPQ